MLVYNSEYLKHRQKLLLEKQRAELEAKKEAAETAADIKKEVENAPPEVKSWYEKKIGSKIDKVLDYFEGLQSNEGDGKEESIKVINGKKYHPLKEQYDRLFKNKTVL